jgi:hypothetical protein
MSTPNRLPPLLCNYCFHPLHEGYKCTQCKCKGKPGIWRKLTDALGFVFEGWKWSGG